MGAGRYYFLRRPVYHLFVSYDSLAREETNGIKHHRQLVQKWHGVETLGVAVFIRFFRDSRRQIKINRKLIEATCKQ